MYKCRFHASQNHKCLPVPLIPCVTRCHNVTLRHNALSYTFICTCRSYVRVFACRLNSIFRFQQKGDYLCCFQQSHQSISYRVIKATSINLQMFWIPTCLLSPFWAFQIFVQISLLNYKKEEFGWIWIWRSIQLWIRFKWDLRGCHGSHIDTHKCTHTDTHRKILSFCHLSLTHTCTRTHIHTHPPTLWLHKHTQTHTNTPPHTHTVAHPNTHTHAHTHTYICNT